MGYDHHLPMMKGLMTVLRRQQRAVSRVVVLAFLLPLLLGLLPQRALSAEEALLRDLATSLCPEDVAGLPIGHQPGDQSDRHGQCVLCVAGTPHAGPLVPSCVSVIATTEDGLFAVPRLDWTARPLRHHTPPDDSPPRGPPLSA
jgi:hypothetical protein